MKHRRTKFKVNRRYKLNNVTNAKDANLYIKQRITVEPHYNGLRL
jgi:hypothetical protein